jgi:hypothetical protein
MSSHDQIFIRVSLLSFEILKDYSAPCLNIHICILREQSSDKEFCSVLNAVCFACLNQFQPKQEKILIFGLIPAKYKYECLGCVHYTP